MLPYSAYGEGRRRSADCDHRQVIVLIGITLSTLSLVMIFSFRNMFRYPIVLDGVPIGLQVAALGGLVWAAGWIAQGFTRPDP
jgi:hypothetical protein